MIVNCDACGKAIERSLGKVNENKKLGWKILCSKECKKYLSQIKEIPCPVCGKAFIPYQQHGKQKATCSYSCSNTYFRSGTDNPNFKGEDGSAYRGVCFRVYPYKCAVCEESNVVEVHHLDKDRSNNQLENLVPLCPTHHKYMHRKKLRPLIEDKLADWKIQHAGLAEWQTRKI